MRVKSTAQSTVVKRETGLIENTTTAMMSFVTLTSAPLCAVRRRARAALGPCRDGVGASHRGFATAGSASHLFTTPRALELLDKHFSPAVKRAPTGNNIVCARAEGSWITDVGGRKYLDFQSGIGVSNTGHSHPR